MRSGAQDRGGQPTVEGQQRRGTHRWKENDRDQVRMEQVTDRNGLGGECGRCARAVYGLKGGSAGERVVPANQSRAVGLG